jgi:hypothetical protein
MSFDFRAITHFLNSPVYEKPWQTRRVLTRLLGQGKGLVVLCCALTQTDFNYFQVFLPRKEKNIALRYLLRG